MHLCKDRNGREIREGDVVRVQTCGSLNGEYPVIAEKDGELYFLDRFYIEDEDRYIETTEMVYGFYPGTLEVVSA